MGFESDRSNLNHSTLKNDILARLTSDVSLISTATCSEDIKALGGLLQSATHITENMKMAQQYWKRPRWPEGLDCDFSTALRAFLREARALHGYSPTDLFPDEKRINEWLGAMSLVLDDLDGVLNFSEGERELAIVNFWQSAVSLHGFLHDINRRSKKFWDYFEEYGK